MVVGHAVCAPPADRFSRAFARDLVLGGRAAFVRGWRSPFGGSATRSSACGDFAGVSAVTCCAAGRRKLWGFPRIASSGPTAQDPATFQCPSLTAASCEPSTSAALGGFGTRSSASVALVGNSSVTCCGAANRDARAFATAAMHPSRIAPSQGQESVWDYPRPPRVERTAKHILITFNGQVIVDTREAYRVLETSHPPVYYIPQTGGMSVSISFQKDIRMQYVHKSPGTSFCEWKGSATYWTVQVGSKAAHKVGWSYESPTPGFVPIQSHIAFYATPMDSCTVDGETVQPQPGGFYGGWITSDVVGPFKGGAGSWGW